MAKIKRITIEFDDGTARELTRRQFISLVRDISCGTVKEALGIKSKRGSVENRANTAGRGRVVDDLCPSNLENLTDNQIYQLVGALMPMAI